MRGSRPTVALVSIARNCENTLERSLDAISRALTPWSLSLTVVVESDSDDRTVNILTRLQRERNNFEFISLGNLRKIRPDRLDRLAYCREVARQKLFELAPEVEWVIVSDLDGPSVSLRRSDLWRSLRNFAASADVVFANSRPRYYDIFALRAEGWVEYSYPKLEESLRHSGLSAVQAKYEAVIRVQKRIKPHQSGIRVQSAFGGLAAYRGKAYQSSSYLADNDGICEHVGFNLKLSNSGHVLIIDPSLIVKGPREHIWASSFILKPIWKLAILFSRLKMLSKFGF